jgi:hypothetical protein
MARSHVVSRDHCGVWSVDRAKAVASLRMVDAHGVHRGAKDSARVAYPTPAHSRGRNVQLSGPTTPALRCVQPARGEGPRRVTGQLSGHLRGYTTHGLYW